MRLSDRLHVRNRFRSEADGTPFFLQPDRDGDPDLYKSIGRTASLQSLAETMIVRSSNLATNLLLDFLGVPTVAEALEAAQLSALRCVRGVEDEAAFAKNLNNQVSAEGLLHLFQRIHEGRILAAESRDRLFDILFQQRFNSMIPSGIPDVAKARVAHKTGEISTVCHDAGMVFLPGRAPYALVILTEYPSAGNAAGRHKLVASISAAGLHLSPGTAASAHHPMNTARDLPVIDGLRLPEDLRVLLRPDELVPDRSGRTHRLPRFFYEVRSWSQAKELSLTTHVRLSELLIVDSREAARLLEEFPHYVPCAVTLLARVLEDFRVRVGASVYIAANGGYRSPAHRFSATLGPHNWGTAGGHLPGRRHLSEHRFGHRKIRRNRPRPRPRDQRSALRPPPRRERRPPPSRPRLRPPDSLWLRRNTRPDKPLDSDSLSSDLSGPPSLIFFSIALRVLGVSVLKSASPYDITFRRTV